MSWLVQGRRWQLPLAQLGLLMIQLFGTSSTLLDHAGFELCS